MPSLQKPKSKSGFGNCGRCGRELTFKDTSLLFGAMPSRKVMTLCDGCWGWLDKEMGLYHKQNGVKVLS